MSLLSIQAYLQSHFLDTKDLPNDVINLSSKSSHFSSHDPRKAIPPLFPIWLLWLLITAFCIFLLHFVMLSVHCSSCARWSYSVHNMIPLALTVHGDPPSIQKTSHMWYKGVQDLKSDLKAWKDQMPYKNYIKRLRWWKTVCKNIGDAASQCEQMLGDTGSSCCYYSF